MNKELLLEIINNNDEREWVEFKTNYPAEKHAQDIGEYISALSNSATLHKQNYAYMIWGVENNTKKIIGTDFTYDLDINGSEAFKHYIARNLEPRISFKFEEIDINGARLVCLTIPAAKEVITEFEHERFIRIGSSKEKLKKFPKYEAELWAELNESKSLRKLMSPVQHLTFSLFEIYLKDFNISYNPDNFFENNKMLTDDGNFNYIAYMFSDQFDVSFKVSKFSGNNKISEFLSRKEFGGGCVLRTIDKVIDYMNGTINVVRSYFDPGKASRRDEFLFNIDAVREAYINAIIHNDWTTKTGPSIFLFNNHLEVFSYGSPLKVQTKSDFLKGKSKPINPDLANIFMKFDKYEASGKGISTILKAYNADVFEFGENNDNFTVSLPYNKMAIEDSGTTPITTPITTPMEETDVKERIIELLRTNNTISATEIANIIGGITRDGVRYHLNKLKSEGRIEHHGLPKSGYWEVKE